MVNKEDFSEVKIKIFGDRIKMFYISSFFIFFFVLVEDGYDSCFFSVGR